MSTKVSVIDDKWLMSKVSDVSSSSVAIALVQGYPATGFARVTPTRVDWRLSPDDGVFDSRYSSDVRLFGDLGEWHCWSVRSDQWRGRLAREADEGWVDSALARDYVLWGTRVDERMDGWTCVSEARGVRLWIPLEANDLPVFLPVKERVDREEDTGIAYIRDAMLRPLREGRS